MAGLVPAISIIEAPPDHVETACPHYRDRRDRPGDDVRGASISSEHALVCKSEIPRLPVRTIDADCASIRLIIRYFVGDVNAWGGVMNYSKQNRVVVATDRTAIPAAVHTMLTLEFDVVSGVYDADTLLSEALRLEPDLVVVEAALSLRDEFRAAGEIMRRLP